MLINDTKPIFVVVLRETERWTVEVEWPDGTIEEAVSAKSASAARNWINQSSRVWIEHRTAEIPTLLSWEGTALS